MPYGTKVTILTKDCLKNVMFSDDATFTTNSVVSLEGGYVEKTRI